MTAPLKDRRILLTRPDPQVRPLAERLRAQGAHVDCFAGLRIRLTPPLSERLALLDQAHFVIFVSTNSVRGLHGADGFKHCAQASFIAIGEATAQALEDVGYPAALHTPPPYNSEALLSLDTLQTLDGQRGVIVRGQDGRKLLAQQLRQRGATVDYLCVYHRDLPEAELSLEALPHGPPEAMCITSVEIAKNLIQCVAPQERTTLLQQALIAGNVRIAEACASMNYNNLAAIANNPGDDAMLDALHHYFSESP